MAVKRSVNYAAMSHPTLESARSLEVSTVLWSSVRVLLCLGLEISECLSRPICPLVMTG